METVCQLSYPLNSENASPSGTRTVYLARPVCCEEGAPPPKTASTERASETTTIATAGTLLLFIASPRCRTGCQHRSYGPAESGTHGWKGQILRYCDRQAPALFFHFGDPPRRRSVGLSVHELGAVLGATAQDEPGVQRAGMRVPPFAGGTDTTL